MLNKGVRLAVFCVLKLGFAGVFAFPAYSETPGDQEARIVQLEDGILAPCCYTEPVSRHQSEIAMKMRLEIARWVAAGKTDQDILDTYVRQYGSRVLVDPRTKPGWWTPWIPWLTAIFAVVLGLWLLQHWRAKPVPAGIGTVDFDLAVLPDLDEEDIV